MDASGSRKANQAYYDAFSERYEARRGRNDPGGYHELVDELEADLVARYATGGQVLEIGCGTGLVLERLARFAREARGIDLSPGMLERARARGLDVVQGSATELPFDDESFDVTCSFKVLAHVPEVDRALAEMTRVTRRGGHVIAEFYNPRSLRGIAKQLAPAGRIAESARESDVFTRFDSPRRIRERTPEGTELVARRGIRIVTPTAHVMRIPGLRSLFRRLEWALSDSALAELAGFYVAVFQRR